MNEINILEERRVLNIDFKIYGDLDNPLFLAKDVAEWIEYDKNKVNEMVAMVDENEKLTETISWSGQGRKMWFLTEDGVYEVLMQSRKPIAKEFKKEVKIILKDIRKHGMYATPITIDSMINDPDFAIKLLTNYKTEKEARLKLEKEKMLLEQKVLDDTPAVEYHERLIDRNLLTNFRDTANQIGLKPKDFTKWLIDNHYVYRKKNAKKQIRAYTEFNHDLFEEKDFESITNDYAGTTTMITVKGKTRFIQELKKAGLI